MVEEESPPSGGNNPPPSGSTFDGSTTFGANPQSQDTVIDGSPLHDHATPDDNLDFVPYVTAMAAFINSPKTKAPLTISVEGTWGSGKSSFMKQLEDELKKSKDKYNFVRFNAWRYDKEDALWGAFALSFIRNIAKKLTPKEAVEAYAKLIKQRLIPEEGDIDRFRLAWQGTFFFIAILVPLVVAFASYWFSESLQLAFEGAKQFGLTKIRGDLILGTVAFLALIKTVYKSIYKPLKEAASLFGNPFRVNFEERVKGPDYEQKIEFIEKFHKDFQKIVNAFSQGRKTIVFIDDLDRCATPKAADLMQAINLMVGDNDKLIFIIGMDREKVAAGFAVKHEPIIKHLYPGESSGIKYGNEFIEKFIQISFRLPNPSKEQIKKMLLHASAAPKSGSDGYVPEDDSHSAWKFFTWYVMAIVYSILWLGKIIFNRLWISTIVKLLWKGVNGIVDKVKAIFKKKERTKVRAVSVQPYDIEEDEDEKSASKFRLGDDDKKVHEIVGMVVPFFASNPRRAKQFLSVFRLRAFIAEETKILRHDPDFPNNPLTPQKMGKFIAIGLRWPQFIDDLQNDRKLLDNLEDWATDNWPAGYTAPSAGDKSVEAKWKSEPALLGLLRYGYFDLSKVPTGNEEGISYINEFKEIYGIDPSVNSFDTIKMFVKKYSLKNINLDKLLNAFPQKGDPIARYEPQTGVTASGTVTAPSAVVSGSVVSDEFPQGPIIIFIGGLPWSFTDRDLAAMFQPFGTVNSAVIELDRMNGNRSKGLGYVEMEIRNEGEAAIQNLNETEIPDPANPERTRKIIVNEARPQENREQRSRERRF